MELKKDFPGLRWSSEILDCSLPMTFDTYNKCAYNCLYCFAYNQKSHNIGKGGTRTGNHHGFQKSLLRSVNPKKIKDVFLTVSKNKGDQQFYDFIRDKKVMQWGGMSDQFDPYEKQNGITLELMKFFKYIDYPISFSTKATWFIYDERYRELIKGQDNWNCKFSIINLDPDISKGIEKGVDSPQARLDALGEWAKLTPKGGATLRLRPFIIGMSDRNNEHLELIKMAKDKGATAVSTEFFCLESRADAPLKDRYRKMSEILGYDIYDFYKQHTKGSGYLRLNYDFKIKYFREMKELCDKIGIRFYVSDAHGKELSSGGNCCGLDKDWNYTRGQITDALLLAKEKGRVYFGDIAIDLETFKKFNWLKATGFNTGTTVNNAIRGRQSMYDWIREMWNRPNNAKSPYKYFNGILFPVGIDDEGNVIYEYRDPEEKKK